MKHDFQKVRALFVAFLVGFPSLSAHGGNLDTIVFGDSASEAAHVRTALLSSVIIGGIGQTARKMFRDPLAWGSRAELAIQGRFYYPDSPGTTIFGPGDPFRCGDQSEGHDPELRRWMDLAGRGIMR